MRKDQPINYKKVNFSFRCDQDWNNMTPSNNGRHCDSCNKNVKDYTRYSLKELQKLKQENDSLCGQFAPHQIDQSLIKLDSTKIKKGFFSTSILFLLGFNSVKAQVQQENKIEQVDSTKSSKSCHSTHEEEKLSDKKHEKYLKKRQRRSKAIQSGFAMETSGRYSTYLCWRYPFIVRKSNIRGKFRL